MKALVVMYDLAIGGSPLTAIDLAASLRDQRGWDLTILASPGPIEPVVEERRLRFRPAPPGGCGIRPASARAIREACREERPDLVHAWDWKSIYVAYFVAGVGMRIPILASVTSATPPPLLPAGIPTMFVTSPLAARDRARRPGGTYLLAAPIDTDRDRPGASGAHGARLRDDARSRFRYLSCRHRVASFSGAEGGGDRSHHRRHRAPRRDVAR